MHLESYILYADESGADFFFVSTGPRGEIQKAIQFRPMKEQGIFNLAFGDLNIDTGELDDEARSNNGDVEKILATVAKATYTFTQYNPMCWIYATGSSLSRNRICRTALDKYLVEIEENFEVFAEGPNGWQLYQKGGAYTAFLIRERKP